MKYVIICIALLTYHFSQAQTQSQIQGHTLGQISTDTSKGIEGNKWAIIETIDVTSRSAGMLVTFENGSRLNLYQLLRADASLPLNDNLYIMAALEYMDKRGYKLISTYVSKDISFNRFIFQHK